MVKKQNINRTIIVVSIICLILLFGYLFGYKQGTFYKFLFSKNNKLVSNEAFIDYISKDEAISNNFESVLRNIIRNVSVTNTPFQTFDTSSPVDFLKSVFESNNFLKLVDFKSDDNVHSISSPIENEATIRNAIGNTTTVLPVTKFLSDKFAELVFFMHDKLKSSYLDSSLPRFKNYSDAGHNVNDIDTLADKYMLFNDLTNDKDLILFLKKYNNMSKTQISNDIYNNYFLNTYRLRLTTSENDPNYNVIRLNMIPFNAPFSKLSHLRDFIFNTIDNNSCSDANMTAYNTNVNSDLNQVLISYIFYRVRNTKQVNNSDYSLSSEFNTTINAEASVNNIWDLFKDEYVKLQAELDNTVSDDEALAFTNVIRQYFTNRYNSSTRKLYPRELNYDNGEHLATNPKFWQVFESNELIPQFNPLLQLLIYSEEEYNKYTENLSIARPELYMLVNNVNRFCNTINTECKTQLSYTDKCKIIESILHSSSNKPLLTNNDTYTLNKLNELVETNDNITINTVSNFKNITEPFNNNSETLRLFINSSVYDIVINNPDNKTLAQLLTDNSEILNTINDEFTIHSIRVLKNNKIYNSLDDLFNDKPATQLTTTTTSSTSGVTTSTSGATTTTSGATSTTSGATTSTSGATTSTRRSNEEETEDMEFQREVLNRLAELYNDNSELSNNLKEAVRKLPMNIRNNICRDYCSVSTTNNSKFCNDIGCSGMSGLSNDALGLMDSLTNDRSFDYANVNNAYSLLDMDNGTMSRYLSTGMYKYMFEDGNMQNMNIPESRRINTKPKFSQTNIIQKDTDGVSNIFAPNIYVLPKRDGSYATYMANDPNDPAYRDFINNLINNYA